MSSLRRLFALIASDYRTHYSYKNETPARRLLLLPLRLIANPSLHASILWRLANATPVWYWPLWRNLLIAKHSFDVHKIEIGPGLVLPHPWGIVVAHGVTIGRNCTVHHNVTLGALAPHQREPNLPVVPRIGDDVVIYCGAIIIGPATIGDGAVIGAYAWIDKDVAPGAVVPGGTRTSGAQSLSALGTATGSE